ncbi:MAG: hypothetical protein QM773_01700 [Hyphomonadaceae bacterium]
MLVRIVQFLAGVLLAGGGGYLAWTQRSAAMNVFPPGAEGMPWLVIAGALGLAAGLTFLVSAVHPRPNRKAQLAAEAAHREETLGAAEAYYSERSRAADRDWRAADIPPPVTPAAPAPAPEPVRAAAPAPPPPPPPAAKPVATSTPPPQPAVTPFPSVATLEPIPKAVEPPPANAQAAPPAPVVTTGLFPEIRTALAEGRLEDADRMLNAERDVAQGAALAELTGLAGDHAAAAGRESHAKWLWRRALSRFGELNAMDTPAARAVADKLRTAG